ncbi:hypothetical protein HHI36_004406, partial [Cryptolaemus montrouzieri]
MQKLKNPSTKAEVRNYLAEQMQKENSSQKVCSELERLSSIVNSASDKYLKPDQNIKRRLATDTLQYIIIHRQIQRKIREANERKLQEDCQEIEALQLKYDSFNIHKK